jgi:hypothetical protein
MLRERGRERRGREGRGGKGREGVNISTNLALDFLV